MRIGKFSGDCTEYTAFIRTFEDQVECKLTSDRLKLRYLEQHLEGEVKDVVKRCIHMANGYIEARKLLKEKYGDPYTK